MSGLKFIETHAHLNSIKSLALNRVLEEASAVGVEKIITVATDADAFNEIIEMAELNSEVFTTQGVHPHSAKDFTSDVLSLIRKNVQKNIHLCSNSKIVAIGEIGLDYYYTFSTRQEQKAAFEAQLALAMELNLPVIIHSREADEDMRDILKNFVSASLRGVLHSYSSGMELAEFVLEHGFYLGLNGMVTFQKAENVRKVAAITPIERILLETDSPYLAPAPHRGKENFPHFIPLIAKKIAELKKISIEEVAEITYGNSLGLFAFSKKSS